MTLPQNKRLLVDGDILLYRCGFAVEKTHYLVTTSDSTNLEFTTHKDAKEQAGQVGIIWSRKEVQPEEFAYEAVNTVLQSFYNKFSPSSIDLFLSDSATFRHRLAKSKPYKGNRDQLHKPVYYAELKDFLLSRGAIILPDVEADDAMSIEATKDPNGTIIVSIDKDMLQVPGNHYNWVKDEFTKQTKKDADWALATQIITGDSTDNIPGLPGAGPAAAKKLLDGAKSSKDLMERVVKAYKEYDPENWNAYLWEQTRLVYLLRTYEEKETNEALSATLQIGGSVQGAAG